MLACMHTLVETDLQCQNALGGRYVVTARLGDGHANGEGKSFKGRLGAALSALTSQAGQDVHVVVVFPADPVNVQSHPGLESKRLQKVRDHLGRHCRSALPVLWRMSLSLRSS